jgi:hypothetical protein
MRPDVAAARPVSGSGSCSFHFMVDLLSGGCSGLYDFGDVSIDGPGSLTA